MSIDYAPLKKVPASDLFDGRLEAFGVREQVTKETEARCPTDGRNYLWVYIDDDGFVSLLTRYAGNAPGKILNAVAEAFETDIVSEYEPQFWGFDTEEERDAVWAAEAQKEEQRFYNDVVKFVRGEAHDIRPDTNGMIWAEIAKQLIADSPDLLAEDKRPDLIKAVKLVYFRDHAVVVRLTDEDLAVAEMAATHEDDLPQA